MRFSSIFLVCLILSCAPENNTLKIACAANIQSAVDSIAEVYKMHTGQDYEVIAGASGTIATQIENGAPYNMFISADKKYSDRLWELKLADQPEQLVDGSLVMVVLVELDSFVPIESVLNDEKVHKIGIADTEVAPFGKATKKFLIELGLWDAIQEKLVYAESVSQLNNYIKSETVDVAFTSNSFVVESDDRFECFTVGSVLAPGVRHYVSGVYENKSCPPQAKRFVNFMQSDTSSKILEYFGYTVD